MLTVLADTFMIATWLEPRGPRPDRNRWLRQAAVERP